MRDSCFSVLSYLLVENNFSSKKTNILNIKIHVSPVVPSDLASLRSTNEAGGDRGFHSRSFARKGPPHTYTRPSSTIPFPPGTRYPLPLLSLPSVPYSSPEKTPPPLPLSHSLLTSLPNILALTQSKHTNTRFLVLKHILKYALRQNKNVIVPPDAKFPLSQLTSATAFSLPMYARLPWWLYSKGPICLTRRSCFWRDLIWVKSSGRVSGGAVDWAEERRESSRLISSVLARELKSRARKAPSCEATCAVGA